MSEMRLPHCDASVLHAPGECRFCDMSPELQEYRQWARINFTGHEDKALAPCPSTHFRPVEVIDRWPGNRAIPEGHGVFTTDDAGNWVPAKPVGWREEHNWFHRVLFWIMRTPHCPE